ncbi:MAG TPA: MFS transporter, partial [Symbiobacteriaceae bacterium]|nr:MFS transporter [Symbiobacteriaceae bacterium]
MDKRIKTYVTAGLMVGLLVAALDQTIVDTAFPRMIAELHGESIFTWVITTYMLASTAIVPVVGKLADIYGRKVFYLVGMALFIGGSMLCGAAQSMTQLILFRSLQGIGGGMLMPIA